MFDADDDDDGDGDGDDDDASLSAIMAQRRSVSAPPTVFRIPRPPATPPPYVPPPPGHPPPGFNPPALNAHSYHCPQCSNTEFRVYMPDVGTHCLYVHAMWACTGNASRAPATAAMRHAPFFGGVDVADDGVITIIKYHHHRRRHQHQTAKSSCR